LEDATLLFAPAERRVDTGEIGQTAAAVDFSRRRGAGGDGD
jgi:hypothetical protein